MLAYPAQRWKDCNMLDSQPTVNQNEALMPPDDALSSQEKKTGFKSCGLLLFSWNK